MPRDQLCRISGGHKLRCDAAAAYGTLALAYEAHFRSPLCITDSYRSYRAQVDLLRRKPSLAAFPGTSNHGWGVAVDLCDGINDYGTPQYEWMMANAAAYGWTNPGWAREGGSRQEPWHWEFASFR
jgi:LAS superfamily LD-carboxypeptidase LdcB